MRHYHLGISAYFHDSAAALVSEGQIIAAAQQERFSRKRHDSSFPADAICYCLDEAGVGLSDLTSISFYDAPDLKFERLISSFASAGPGGLAAFQRVFPEWIRWKARPEKQIMSSLLKLNRGHPKVNIIYGTHHRSHAASAFYPSPYNRAAVLCIDGVGEWQTTTIWHGEGSDLTLKNAISYPHSLGLLYSAFTEFCGFKVDSGEYKLMGLAPYGEPIYAQKILDELITLRCDGSFSLNMNYFTFLQGQNMVGEKFESLFGRSKRQPESVITQDDCDFAASIQKVAEEVVLGLARAAKQLTGEDRLCLAGGVALNCVANGCLSRARIFDEIWIQPAAGDAGCALGIALEQDAKCQQKRMKPASGHRDAMQGAYLGPAFSDERVMNYLNEQDIPHQLLSEEEMLSFTAEALASGKVVGWFQGKMEFGPRALGARSILGDPRNIEMQKTMNLKIKFRESFRPFAPMVLAERASEFFDIRQESPYMLVVSEVRKKWLKPVENRHLGSINDVRSTMPAITHVDNSARVQTVHPETNPLLARLLQKFDELTDYPVLVNTSFNVRGEPIVCTPAEAYLCFMRTNIDLLVLGNCVLRKEEQPALENDSDWRTEIALD
ncbi:MULTISPECIES: carbamoyltransferase family protein [Enterobacter]|uniref:carbamoyltransferase family protein n=1 Tax=Enterobacter TaxID=547 RepID=UPI001F5AA669|nr:carbamoyltransferase [Enterobacter cloacae complex sp. 2022EL-00788]MCI2291121.1 carbamoyltransferase [Enterobacter sp. I4]MCM7513500.1 carbamoyltransferase [Enterobacter hormaechei]MCY0772069.1 carbamoyltransferase [Enterobacter cloacae complex sp. 2022EL-00788]